MVSGVEKWSLSGTRRLFLKMHLHRACTQWIYKASDSGYAAGSVYGMSVSSFANIPFSVVLYSLHYICAIAKRIPGHRSNFVKPRWMGWPTLSNGFTTASTNDHIRRIRPSLEIQPPPSTWLPSPRVQLWTSELCKSERNPRLDRELQKTIHQPKHKLHY